MKQRSTKLRRRGRRAVKQISQPVDAFTAAVAAGGRPSFGFLNTAAMDKIKRRSFDLLADHGIIVIHPEARIALQKAGAKQGRDADRVRLPRGLVETAAKVTPKAVSLYGKNQGLSVHLPREDGGFIMRTGTGAHGYVDPRDADYRNLDLKAVREIGAVASGLDQIGFIAHPFVHGVPEVTADIHSFATMVAHTHKHCLVQPYGKETIEFLMEIAVIAAGGENTLRQRPLASCITCSFTPLEFKYMDTEVIIQAGRHGLPLHACTLPSAGGTAPLTPVGMVLMATAEILAMVTMAHVLAPGTPVIATPLMFTLDMRTGSALQSCPESLQAASMAIQVMKQGFGLPTHTYGSGSDTPDGDVQSMAERAMLGQAVVLSGADILGGVGQLECATVFSPVQAVLDNEIGAMLRRFIQMPQVSDGDLNWQEISNIRAGGHFLGSSHTLNFCRDQYIPQMFLRQGRDDYEASDRRTAFDQAREKSLDLIRNAPPDGVLNEGQKAAIAKVVADGDRLVLGRAARPGTVDVI